MENLAVFCFVFFSFGFLSEGLKVKEKEKNSPFFGFVLFCSGFASRFEVNEKGGKQTDISGIYLTLGGDVCLLFCLCVRSFSCFF